MFLFFVPVLFCLRWMLKCSISETCPYRIHPQPLTESWLNKLIKTFGSFFEVYCPRLFCFSASDWMLPLKNLSWTLVRQFSLPVLTPSGSATMHTPNHTLCSRWSWDLLLPFSCSPHRSETSTSTNLTLPSHTCTHCPLGKETLGWPDTTTSRIAYTWIHHDWRFVERKEAVKWRD